MDKLVIVTDAGFGGDDWQRRPVITCKMLADTLGADDLSNAILYLQNDDEINDALLGVIDQITAIAIAFPTSADGRGFSLARLLRLHGYKGRLRAIGHILADQYRHIRQSGFDEVGISQSLAERITENHWQEQVARLASSYQDRLYTDQV